MLEQVLTRLGQLLRLHPQSPVPTVPPPLILAGGPRRPGLSALRSANHILTKKRALGLPVGAYEDGTANADDQIILAIFEEIYRAIREDAHTDIAIPPGLPLAGTGTSGAGPVAVVGATTAPWGGYGVVQ